MKDTTGRASLEKRVSFKLKQLQEHLAWKINLDISAKLEHLVDCLDKSVLTYFCLNVSVVFVNAEKCSVQNRIVFIKP